MKERIIVGIMLLFVLTFTAACGQDTEITGKVIDVEKYGHVVLDITTEEFGQAGFELGDIVTVNAGTYTGDVPCLNGYYVDKGEYMVRVPDNHPNITVCINYGDFSEETGTGIGDTVTIAMKEKAGALELQQISDLTYTDDREDYASDEVFANFRPIKEGVLYRSASPVNNERGRAPYADDLAEQAEIKTVMNLASTEEEIDEWFGAADFDSPYYQKLYENSGVITLGLPIDFDSDDFGKGIVKGLTFLAENEPPYLVHCNEGKDRAGFASMVLEELMGWSEDEIVSDYMVSYQNYYRIEPGTDKFDTIAEKNVKEMMRSTAGLQKGASLEGVDLKAAAEKYLKDHGMEEKTLKKLEERLK